jgi:hypothetical protein
MLEAFRTFAHANPEGYQLLFARLPEGWRADDALTAEISQAVVRAVGDLSSGQNALEAARTVVAWAHGFVSMELAGAFRLGGDVDEAFAFGIERITAAVMREADDGRS